MGHRLKFSNRLAKLFSRSSVFAGIVEQSLAASASDPLGCGDLVLDGMPLDPTASATRQPQDGHTTAVIETVEASTEEILDLLGEEESDSDEAQVPAASSLGKLTAALGQELRSPLPLLQSFASLLSDRHEDPEFRRTFQDLVLANTTRAAEFAERLEALGELDDEGHRAALDGADVDRDVTVVVGHVFQSDDLPVTP